MWQNIVQYFHDDFSSFLTDFSVIAVIVAALGYILKKLIENKLSKQLNREIEELKHFQSRMLKDYDLYTSKRHLVYPEAYKSLELAFGSIMRLRGHKRSLTFENVDSSDIETFMVSKNFTSHDKSSVLALWEKDRLTAIKMIEGRIKFIEYNEAYEKWGEANDYVILNELFMSKTSADSSREFLDKMHDYWTMLDPDYPHEAVVDFQEDMKKLRGTELPQLREKLKDMFRNELTQTFEGNK